VNGSLAETWIFGYGSLVWRPSFAHVERQTALLRGYSRRFWQGSTDHRGVPGAPGRVVTLVAEAGARCLGTAYRIDPQDRDEVIAALDHREKGGYDGHLVTLELPAIDRHIEGALVYIASPGNPNHLGPASLGDIAAQVRRARGPSGPNVEYVTRLAEALRAMGAEDPHVFDLERLVLEPTA
jgi:cation transport protein ChaC